MEIFLVEDDLSIVNQIRKYTDKEFVVFSFSDFESARSALDEHGTTRIFILDESLPDGKGSDLCSLIRSKFGRRPYILILSKISELKTKLNAYQLGADDYLIKPFEPLELISKVKSIIERMALDENKRDFLFHGIFFDFAQIQAYKIENEVKKSLELTPKEFLIFSLFAQNIGRLFTRNQILEKVWGEQTNVTDRTIDQHINHIRKKLANPMIQIEAVRGEGYRIITLN